MNRPLVSVITGTWQRHELLLGAIENVRQQTYRPIEHVIVSDGADIDLEVIINRSRNAQWERDLERFVPIRFVQLGRNWSSFLTDSLSAVPFAVAQWMAAGEYQCWWADDERALVPDHIDLLVAALEAESADFAYSKVEMYWKDRPEKRMVQGERYPRLATFTHCLHRADILDVPPGGFQTHVGRANDHEQVERWIAAGKTWAFVDRVTFEHRIDR